MTRDPRTPEEFARMEDFARRVRSTIDSLSGSLTGDERAVIYRLIEHNEHGEALVSLAWALSDNDQPTDPAVVSIVRNLSDGLVADEDLPPAFRGPFR